MEEQIRQIAQRVYDENQAKNQNTSLKVARHIHNGIDVPRINQNDVVNGAVWVAGLTSISSETFTMEIVNGINNISLHGIAYDTSSSPAVKKSTLNGNAQFGNCFQYATSSGTSYVQTVGAKASQYSQTSSSIYINTADLTATKVFATGGTDSSAYLAYVLDETGTVMATIQIIDWKNNSITIQVVLATNWTVIYFLTLS